MCVSVCDLISVCVDNILGEHVLESYSVHIISITASVLCRAALHNTYYKRN